MLQDVKNGGTSVSCSVKNQSCENGKRDRSCAPKSAEPPKTCQPETESHSLGSRGNDFFRCVSRNGRHRRERPTSTASSVTFCRHSARRPSRKSTNSSARYFSIMSRRTAF